MANENVPAPAPIRFDDQILLFAAWVPIGKSNFVLDLQKKQKNPIFQISVDILQNTNFFRAFIASASVLTIYIQQFWNTLTYEAKTRAYSFQLDETRFVLDANLLREALEITPIDQSHQFVSPPSGDAIMDFVNELGYTEEIHFVSRMAVNNLYQPWRAILSMINQCLTCNTSRYDRPRYRVLQMLWGIITSINVDYAELMWEEFVQAIQTFLTEKANLGSPTKKGRKDKPQVIPYCQFTELIICHLGRKHNLHQRFESPLHLAEEDLRLGNLKFIPKGEDDEVFGMPIPNELITNNIRNAPYYNAYLEMVAKHDQKIAAEKGGKKKPVTAKQLKPKPIKDKSSKPAPAPKPKKIRKGKSSLQLIDEDELTQPEPEPEPEHQAEATRPLPVVEGKGKAIATEEQAAQSLLALHTPKRRSTTDQFIFQRRTPATEEASTRPSAQPRDDTSANIVHDFPSPADAKTGADTDKTNSRGDTEILQIGEEQGEDVDNQANLEEKTAKLDQGQAGSNPADEHVILEDPLSSSRNLSSMKNLDDAYTIRDQFLNDKSTEDEPGKLNMESELVSMVTVLIYQASSSVPSLSTPVIDLSLPKLVPSTTQAPIFTATTTTTTTILPPPPQQQSTTDSELVARVTALEKKFSDFEQKSNTLDNTTQNLRSRVFTLELRDLPHKINQTVNEVVKEAVKVALQAPLRDRFRELPEADIKEIIHQRMFESGTYKSLPEHVALYEALEASMERANRDEFFAKKDKSRKRRHDDQDPPPPPPDSDPSKKRRHASNASGSTQPPASQSSAWKTSNTREVPSRSSKQKSASHSEQPVKDVSIPDDVNVSDFKDTDIAHLPKIKTRPDWLKLVPEEDRPATPEPDWVIPPNELPETKNNWANALASSYQDPDKYKLLRQTSDMSSFINWFCKRIGKKKLSKADLVGPAFKDIESCLIEERRSALSISKLKAANYPDFGLEELVPSLWIESEWDYDISAAYGISHWCFKRKEFYITRHSAPSDRSKVRSHMQILSVDASDFLFKEDYTIVSKPRAVIYKDINDQKKMMRETDVHKFSDGTLNMILDKLDHMVKDFKLFKFNPGIETRIWSEVDRRRSKEFMEVIERRLKIRRIFRSLESFVGGRLRDVDYRLI
ncbi:hypothetical protein Tco_1355402 [Tanacetum coccineum]